MSVTQQLDNMYIRFGPRGASGIHRCASSMGECKEENAAKADLNESQSRACRIM